MEHKKFYDTEEFEYKKFYNLEEIEKYYNEKTNTYSFEENGVYLNVIFLFDLEVNSNIYANNIIAERMICLNIIAERMICLNISASAIDASNIVANRIIANIICANAVNVKGNIIYSDKIVIRFSTRCEGLLHNTLSNW